MTYSERKDFCGKFNFITNLISDVVTKYNNTYVFKIKNYRIDSVDANQQIEAIDIFLILEHKTEKKEFKFTFRTSYWDDPNFTCENYQDLILFLTHDLWNGLIRTETEE